MKRLILPLALCSTLAACGGGGGSSDSSSTTTEGLEMPTTLSVVTAKDETSGKVEGLEVSFGAFVSAALFNDAGTDFTNDPSRVYVYDPSIEPLETVNMIMCLIEQTLASEMVNAGPYLALINSDKCERENDSGAQNGGGESGGSSSSQVSEFETWTINVTRADDSSPQIVNIWIPGDPEETDPRDGQDILVKVIVTEGVSDSDPFGQFTLHFKGVADSGVMMGGSPSGTYSTVMAGTLQTVANSDNKPQFQFINLSGDDLLGGSSLGFGRAEKTNVILDDANGNSGIAKTYNKESDGGPAREKLFNVAFVDSLFLRSAQEDSGPVDEVCTSRDNFNTQIWRYNLYHKDDGTFNTEAVTGGQRVELNSGFPFEYDGNWGHVGYWGLWYDGDSLADGTVIDAIDFSTGEKTPHTINMSNGKMSKRTANTLALSELTGKEFFGWIEHPDLGAPAYPQDYNFDSWVITYNGTKFVITGGVSWGESGPTIDDTVTDSTSDLVMTDEQLWLWSDGLGGNIVFIGGKTEVVFYQHEFVTASGSLTDGDTLYCYERCPQGGVTAPADENAFYYGYYEDSLNAGADTNNTDPTAGGLRTYTVNITGGVLSLTDDTNSELVEVTTLPMGWDWGMESGEMLDTAMTDVYHSESNAGGANNAWQVYDLSAGQSSYRWETGTNDWNKSITLTRNSDSAVVNFDKPIAMTYTHSTANDRNDDASNDGDTFLLEYGGSGDLWGFPWEPVEGCDMTTEECHWVSAVTLKDGAELSDGTNTFVVKGIEMEQTMVPYPDLTNCTTAGLDTTDAEALALLDTVDTAAVDFTVGDKPTVTDDPAVVEGEMQ